MSDTNDLIEFAKNLGKSIQDGTFTMKDEEKESIKRQIEDIERLEKELGYSDEGISHVELPEEEQEFIAENIIIRNEEKE